MPTRTVRIDYTIRDGVELDTVKARIGEFVAGIRGHDAAHRYTSYQHVAAPRQFTHVGTFDDRVTDLQAQPFFGAFTAFLREHCEHGPVVTQLAEVASTR
jgi:hypothetical protein